MIVSPSGVLRPQSHNNDSGYSTGCDALPTPPCTRPPAAGRVATEGSQLSRSSGLALG